MAKVTAEQDGSIKVDWSSWVGVAKSNVKDYDVFCSTEPRCTITEINHVARGITGRSCIISGLRSGVTYDVRVRPNGWDGPGVPSE